MNHEKYNYQIPEHQPSEPDAVFVQTVVNQVQLEIGSQIKLNPAMSVQEIKLQATNRFVKLVEQGLLTEREANRCYQRFIQMVDYYYGTP